MNNNNNNNNNNFIIIIIYAILSLISYNVPFAFDLVTPE